MKNENIHMQALHHKLDVLLVQILPYNCSETDCAAFARIHPPPAGLPQTREAVGSSRAGCGPSRNDSGQVAHTHLPRGFACVLFKMWQVVAVQI